MEQNLQKQFLVAWTIYQIFITFRLAKFTMNMVEGILNSRKKLFLLAFDDNNK